MSETVMYGIKNCDTIKKARKWMDAHSYAYRFHDYKAEGVDDAVLRQAISQFGWAVVINTRGTTWRQLPDDVKQSMNDDTAVKIAADNPSVIKRPLLVHENQITVGFKDAIYSEIFS